MAKNNLYNYVPAKSKNEEVHFFSTKGRITRKTLFFRFLFITAFASLVFYIYFNYALPKKEFYATNGELPEGNFKTSFETFENFTFFVVPLFVMIFINIQYIKRIHDVNKSGWCVLVPFYNIYLIFTRGTFGENNFGIDPQNYVQDKYFDGSEVKPNILTKDEK